jgi:hypothetical protein
MLEYDNNSGNVCLKGYSIAKSKKFTQKQLSNVYIAEALNHSPEVMDHT